MADCEAPSFSLGLDLLFDSEPHILADPINTKPQFGNEENEDFSHAADSDPETRTEPPTVFRRLRRGLPPPREATPLRRSDVDDEIEEFSSQEDVLEGEFFYSLILCLDYDKGVCFFFFFLVYS